MHVLLPRTQERNNSLRVHMEIIIIIIIIIIMFVDFIMICPYKYNYIDSLNLK